MTNKEKWLTAWKDYMYFMLKNKRRPSKYKDEESALVNWAKQNRKIRNRGMMDNYRKRMFELLTTEAQNYRRVNQYAYADHARPLYPHPSE